MRPQPFAPFGTPAAPDSLSGFLPKPEVLRSIQRPHALGCLFAYSAELVIVKPIGVEGPEKLGRSDCVPRGKCVRWVSKNENSPQFEFQEVLLDDVHGKTSDVGYFRWRWANVGVDGPVFP
jgi:hypothetical protein